jgi:tetratricopeptide (TPR) repeat protein
VHAEEDPTTAAERAIDFLKEFSRRNKRKLLLFIDNFDLIFSDQIRQDSAVRRFRDVLMNDNFLLILATAPTYFEEVMGYDQPLYNFFKIYDLDEFDVDLTEALLRKRAELDGNEDLVAHLDEYRPKLEALHRLTGGNPRLILILYQLLVFAELPEVKEALSALLDDLTPYFKHKLESITSPQQRKIIDTMARMDQAATPTELAAATRLPVNQVSSLLKRLQSDGYVKPAKQKQRKATFYIITERLFRIWHQMRYSTDRNRRLPFLVEFISLWYSLEDLKTEFSRLEYRLRSTLDQGRRVEALGTLEHIGYLAEAAPSGELRDKFIDSTIHHYIELGEWERAEIELQRELEKNVNVNNVEGMAKNNYRLGIIYWEKARLSNDEDLFQEAFEKFNQAVTVKPDMHEAWNGIGILNAYKEETEVAINNFKKAIKMAEDKQEIENVKSYYDNFLHAVLDLTAKYIAQNDTGQAIGRFREVLEYKSQLEEKAWRERLLLFFDKVVSERNVPVFFELYDSLIEKSLEEEIELLRPFAIACEYWRKNEDAEVLDRLNPEVREVVEDIIRKSGEQKGANDEETA